MSIIEQAKYELGLINFGAEDTEAMVGILEKFFDQWDSGGAVHCVAPILMKCLAGQPLSPLTGDENEWNEVGPDFTGQSCWQNKRDSSVFRDGNWRCYDIDTPGRPTITFPYTPPKNDVASPVVEIGA